MNRFKEYFVFCSVFIGLILAGGSAIHYSSAGAEISTPVVHHAYVPPCSAASVVVPPLDLDPALAVHGDQVTQLQAVLGIDQNGVFDAATAQAVPQFTSAIICKPDYTPSSVVLTSVATLQAASSDLTTTRNGEIAAAAAEAERQAQAAAAAAKAAQAKSVQVVQQPQVTVAPSPDCYGVNAYAAWIYMKESGCNPANPGNPNCEGIGQACPRGKMGCSWTDVPCQLAFFDNYANERYGGWLQAYNFWQANGWW